MSPAAEADAGQMPSRWYFKKKKIINNIK